MITSPPLCSLRMKADELEIDKLRIVEASQAKRKVERVKKFESRKPDSDSE
jgi:hypothetical protein